MALIKCILCLFGVHGVPVGRVKLVDYMAGQRFRYDAFVECPHCGKRLESGDVVEEKRALLVNPQGVVSTDYCTVECAERWCRGRPGWTWLPYQGERDENGHAKAG